jgi:hypothetical protein
MSFKVGDSRSVLEKAGRGSVDNLGDRSRPSALIEALDFV